jgi:hypothetical protein
MSNIDFKRAVCCFLWNGPAVSAKPRYSLTVASFSDTVKENNDVSATYVGDLVWVMYIHKIAKHPCGIAFVDDGTFDVTPSD